MPRLLNRSASAWLICQRLVEVAQRRVVLAALCMHYAQQMQAAKVAGPRLREPPVDLGRLIEQPAPMKSDRLVEQS